MCRLYCNRWCSRSCGSTDSMCPIHGAPACRRFVEQRQGVANCRRYGHEGHPRVGAPCGRGQYVSRPGMRKVSQTNLVATARGMHWWLRRVQPKDDNNEESDAGASEQPPRKAAKAVQRGDVEREWEKRPVPRGQPGRPPRSRSSREGGGGAAPPLEDKELGPPRAGGGGRAQSLYATPPPPGFER